MFVPLLILASGTAIADTWVSVWKPPAPPGGGVEYLVDASSIKFEQNIRRANIKMDFVSRLLAGQRPVNAGQ